MSDEVARKLAGALDLAATIELGVVLVALGAGLAAAVALLRAQAPALSLELEASRLAHGGGKRFLLGLVNAPALFLVAVFLIKTGTLRVLGLAVLLGLALLVLLGLVAELAALGSPLRAGALLSLSLLLPVAGWLLVLVVLLRALGTGLFWLAGRGRETPVP